MDKKVDCSLAKIFIYKVHTKKIEQIYELTSYTILQS